VVKGCVVLDTSQYFGIFLLNNPQKKISLLTHWGTSSGPSYQCSSSGLVLGMVRLSAMLDSLRIEWLDPLRRYSDDALW